MEKNGLLNISEDEIFSFNSTGVVPERIKRDWGITDPKELRDILDSRRFNTTPSA